MKTLRLGCTCGKSVTVCGANADEIIEEIDKTGWQDMPPGEDCPHGCIVGICPDCQVDDEYLGEPE